MGEKKFHFITRQEDEGKRVDAFLVHSLESEGETASRSLIADYKERILINGITKKPSAKIKTGDIIDFSIPEKQKLELVPENIPFEMVYEDADMLVINKPPGLVVHPAKSNFTHTLVHGILHKIQDLGSFNNVERPGIVHRLDKDTSGLIIVAKNIKSHRILIKMFKERTIEKTYYAIVHSEKLPAKGVIDKPIGRHPVRRKKFTVIATGKDALTEYKTLSSRGSHHLVEVKIHTGRTHQIRVHFSAIGAPLVGDVIYSKKWNKYQTKGLALVAKRLRFHHPVDCRLMEFEIDLPEHFKKLLDELDIIL